MAISIDNLSHVYLSGEKGERTALRDVTLDLATGESLGIVGESGSGKSTLLRHLNGLLKPTSGTVRVNGMSIGQCDARELRQQVGLVFQLPEEQLFEETVFREIAFGLAGSGLGPDETGCRVREALQKVGLDAGILETSPFALPDGDKRRVAIAGVLVRRPTVVVLDEPTAGLDPEGRRRILDLMTLLQRDPEVTLVVVTHDMDLLARVTDRLALLKGGRLVRSGPTRELFCDNSALQTAGVAPPPVTTLMRQLKDLLPDLRDDILTVEEARSELNRVMAGVKGARQ